VISRGIKGIPYGKTAELDMQKKARKGLGDVMGGKVLELESDRLIKQGMTIGETARKLKLPEEEVQQIWEETEG